jgi:hypothetical protein
MIANSQLVFYPTARALKKQRAQLITEVIMYTSIGYKGHRINIASFDGNPVYEVWIVGDQGARFKVNSVIGGKRAITKYIAREDYFEGHWPDMNWYDTSAE